MTAHIILRQQPGRRKSTQSCGKLAICSFDQGTSEILKTDNKPHHHIYQHMKASDYTSSHSSRWYNYIRPLKFQFQRRVISLVIGGCYLCLLWTLLPVSPPVISLGCSKTPCLRAAVNEWHSSMPLMPAAVRAAFLIVIFLIWKVSK